MSTNCLRLLVVEDNPGDVMLLEEAFADSTHASFALAHVERLEEAMVLVRQERFDLVLLDLSLPDSHGIETFFRLRERSPHTPIVVLTGTDDAEVGHDAVQAGAQDYLVKGRLENDLMVRALQYAVTRHKMQEAIRAASLIDDLTGLYNRRGFLILAEQQLRMADRTNEGMLLIYVDLDGMKLINDSYGHQAGDQALLDTAAILKRTFRESDVIARMGGDEFIVVAVDAPPDSQAMLLARLDQNVSAHNLESDRPYVLEMSAGIARYVPRTHWIIEQLVAQADSAMYKQKHERINRQRVAA
ncbi:MAG: GGDEF domain-containing protein [Capsulimonadaceae bacterium]